MASTLDKRATHESDGSDTDFERNFADMALIFLRDQAPSLLDYLVGFQMLDRDAEDNRAAGVFGFKVGPQMLQAPVLFVNGQLKGHQILDVPSKGIKVPLKENWIDFLLRKAPTIIGDTVERNSGRLGARQPFIHGSIPPYFKLGAEKAPEKPFRQVGRMLLPTWCLPTAKKMAELRLRGPEFGPLMGDDLLTFVKKAGRHAAACLARDARDLPWFRDALQKFYGYEAVAGAVKEASSHLPEASSPPGPPVTRFSPLIASLMGGPEEPDPIKTGGLVVIRISHGVMTSTRPSETKDDGTEPLTAEEKTKLLQDDVLFRDRRNQKSKVYNIQRPTALTTPTSSGVFDVMVNAEGTKRMVVLTDLTGPGESSKSVLVIDPDDMTWDSFSPGDVLVSQADHPDEWKKFYDKLPGASTLEDRTTLDGYFCFVGPNGEATVPVRLDGEPTTVAGQVKRFPASGWCGYDSRDSGDFTNASRKGVRRSNLMAEVEGASRYADKFVAVNPALDRPERAWGGLVVPESWKLLQLESRLHTCRLTSEADLMERIFQTSHPLSLRKTGSVYRIKDRELSRTEALCELVARHGLEEKVARLMIDRADLGLDTSCRIKYAAPYKPQHGMIEPAAMPDPEMTFGGNFGLDYAGSVPATFPVSYDIMNSVTPPDIDMLRLRIPEPDPAAGMIAQQASRRGIKEVFDAASTMRILKSFDQGSLIDGMIPFLIKAMSKLADAIQSFSWHPKQWEERYGKGDLSLIEDSLTNMFFGLGDLILKLNEGSQVYDQDSLVAPDIDPLASM